MVKIRLAIKSSNPNGWLTELEFSLASEETVHLSEDAQLLEIIESSGRKRFFPICNVVNWYVYDK